ncbi:hypothetical protein [Legionella feeleii]|uniref:Membrane-associated HD superfamily hydrolase n=1 Tax=Legionella feeleii TaxID=453 RepID=A0A378IYF1_9GAMM|nr:hypothetical protein [Legionella feeleii]STX37054.1 Uncharacterised protein [Legionella feeleii]
MTTIEKDSALRKQILHAERIKQLEMKAELAKLNSERREANAKDFHAKDAQGNPAPKSYWQKVAENAQVLQKKGMENYADWVSGMNSIVNTLMDLSLALAYDPIGNSDYAALGMLNMAGELVHEMVPFKQTREVAWEGVAGWTLQKIGAGPLGKLGLGTPLPAIKFSVNVDDDGRLTSSATKDGVAFSEKEKMHFDAGVLWWAEQNGYKPEDPKAETLVLKDSDGNVMDSEAFKKLSMDRTKGLQCLMEGRFEMAMDYVHASSPQP